MKLLLDTHAYLWWLADDRKLRTVWREAIAHAQSTVYVSAATVWEIAIKAALGRLDLGGGDAEAEIERNGFLELAITAKHASTAGNLPRHHHDPFDRMLIAQARSSGLTLVSADKRFAGYGVPLLEG